MVELIHGDCFEYLKKIEKKSIDLVLTDPPYLVTDLEFDKKEIGLEWVEICLDIVKDNGYLVTFYPLEKLAEITKIWKYRFTGVWLKDVAVMMFHSVKKPRMQSELFGVYAHPNHKVKNLTWNIVTYKSTPYKKVQRRTGYKRGGKDQLDRVSVSGWTKDGFVCINDGYRQYTNVIKASSKQCMSREERTSHPTQKPVELLDVIIKWTTNEGDTVLDPFMGSGSTGVSCVRNKRNFIGIEINKEYYNVAKNRIEKENSILMLDL